MQVTGAWQLVRLAVRRDRVLLPTWIAGIVLMVVVSAPSVLGLYDSEGDRLTYARAWAGSVVARMFNGPAAGPDTGAIVVAETSMLLILLTPLMSIFTVVRHTRQNEETGRSELLGSAIVGRYAVLTAALTVTFAADLAVGAGVAAALVAAGLAVSGAVVTGAAVALVGMCFAAVAAVSAQVVGTARGANGTASAVLGVAFLLRAVGEGLGTVDPGGLTSSTAWPSWLTPLGWVGQVFPFTKNDPLPLLLLSLGTLAGLVASVELVARRDVGSGLVAPRPGPAVASRALRSPLGLARRLHRGAFAGWLASFVTVGIAMGAVTDQVDDMIGGNPEAADLVTQLGGSDLLVDAYLTVVMGYFAFFAAGYAVQGTIRLRVEEAFGTAEPVLSGAVSRVRWVASHLVVVVSGTAALLLASGLAVGISYGLVTGDVAAEVPRLLGAAVVQLPAVLVLTAVVLLVFAVAPSVTSVAGWGLLVVTLLMNQLGELLDLPRVLLDISPFSHTPRVPAAAVDGVPLVVLCAVALAGGALALALLRLRDIPA